MDILFQSDSPSHSIHDRINIRTSTSCLVVQLSLLPPPSLAPSKQKNSPPTLVTYPLVTLPLAHHAVPILHRTCLPLRGVLQHRLRFFPSHRRRSQEGRLVCPSPSLRPCRPCFHRCFPLPSHCHIRRLPSRQQARTEEKENTSHHSAVPPST
ncbi:hypothetical protein DFH11DRAFT_1605815 [Phellopilus nigrolimitatus]|nr:hypothetical protein DFH11DRAFT_1605815 [Phellopilus nigrolimitatus]